MINLFKNKIKQIKNITLNNWLFCSRFLIIFFVFIAIFYGLVFHASVTLGQTRVTTYISQVQEERYDSRFTLTQWLLIKERMRMMDVWLAMFTEPSQSKFRPEIGLSYFKTKSNFDRFSKVGLQGASMRGQLWLTNLISSKVGIRMLNVDFGGEFQREEHRYQGGLIPNDQGQLVSESSSGISDSGGVSAVAWKQASQGIASENLGVRVPSEGSSRLQSFMGNLRLFGKHVQDSSLVLKYGEYRYQGFDPTGINLLEPMTFRGPLMGAELTLYVSSWLGMTGQFQSLGAEPSGSRVGPLGGSFGEGQIFIEIAVLRLAAGTFERRWVSQGSNSDETQKTPAKQRGVFTGLSLHL